MSLAADRALGIAARFAADGAVSSVEKLPGGNINDTWLARALGRDFILQRINHEVFREPPLVVHNMRVVTGELARRCNGEDPALARRRFPEVIASNEGADICRDAEGNWWRAITYLDGTFSVDRPSGPDQAAEAGRALGVFHRLIADLPPTDLHDTLPGFHVTPGYVADFDRASLSTGGKERLAASAGARSAADWVESSRGRSGVLEDAARAGLLAPRPIHGDPKIANLLFDQATGRCVSVIDLIRLNPACCTTILETACGRAATPPVRPPLRRTRPISTRNSPGRCSAGIWPKRPRPRQNSPSFRMPSGC